MIVLSSSVALRSVAAQTKSDGVAESRAQEICGENWIVERETLSGGDRVLPGVRSFLGRLRARGGFPYAKLLLSDKGELLARSEGRELLARAAAKRICFRLRDGKPEITEGGRLGKRGLKNTLRALLGRLKPVGRDVGNALSASVAIVTVLTVKGKLEAATVRPTEAGLIIRITWNQGSDWWEFKERADWTLRFDGSGALAGIEKNQQAYTRRMLR
jgi:hypothetical protein